MAGLRYPALQKGVALIMLQLLFLLLLLVVPYLTLTLADRWSAGFKIAPTTRARVGLSLFFIFTATGHFITTEEMSAMLPFFAPSPNRFYISPGVLSVPRSLRFSSPFFNKPGGFLPPPN